MQMSPDAQEGQPENNQIRLILIPSPSTELFSTVTPPC